jgi:hypothetical protein
VAALGGHALLGRFLRAGLWECFAANMPTAAPLWVTLQGRLCLPAPQTYWEDDLTHAFCVSRRQTLKVAHMVGEVVSRQRDEAGERNVAVPAASSPLSKM